jgi:putative NIF3 family GTP cyclohydrolase 1 type 2
MSPVSRRSALVSAGGAVVAAKALMAQDAALTAKQVVERIQANLGVPWRAVTVDNFKAGSNPDAPLRGIATTMVATYDLLRRASAANRNFIIVHEPTFYNHQDDPKDLASDPMFILKRDFIAANNLSVFRFHDHWHARRPDGIVSGMAVSLGWKNYQDAEDPRLFTIPATSLETLAAGIRDRLKVRAMRIVGDPKTVVRRAAFNPGSTGVKLVMRYFASPDIDVLVCGEPGEWDAVEYARDTIASGKKKGMILLGHDMSEEGGMEECARWVRGFVTEVPVEFISAGEAFWTLGRA